MTATDGSELELIHTDEQGRYTLSVYRGSLLGYRTYHAGGGLVGLDGLGSRTKNVWKWDQPRHPSRPSPLDLSRFKDITLVFEDERGEPVPNIQIGRLEASVRGQVVSRTAGGIPDRHGLHLFLDREVDRLDIETREIDPISRKSYWLPLKRTIDLEGTQDQVVDRLRALADECREK
jgi:hypothetical protein